MPRYILLIIFSINSLFLAAQNKPVNSPMVPAPTRTPRTVPVAYQDVKLNYLRVWYPNIPLTTADTSSIPTRPNADVQQETSYFDRMGRVVQTVKRGITPQGKDMIYPKEYSLRGKEEQQYLPYPSAVYDGGFRDSAFFQQNAYYTSLSAAGQRFAGEKFYYAEEEFENSPLDRKTKELPLGNSWVGSNRGMSTAHLLNTVEEMIVKWNIASTEGSVPQADGYYTAGLLTKIQTTDPSGKKSVVYKDFDGNIILKKEEVGTGGVTYDGWLCTYFVYDEAGQQRFIIPPLAVEKIKSTWNLANYPGVVENLCFYQEYDDRGRVIREKVPDMGFTERVYDNRDRLVFHQNAEQRSKGVWEIELYDQMNRGVMAGLYKSTKTRLQLQNEMNNAPASGSMTINYTITTHSNLVVTTRVHHIREYIASTSVTFDPEFDSGGDEFEATIDPNLKIVNTTVAIVANNPLPSLNSADLIPLSYKYYDNYNWSGSYSFEPSYINKPEIGNNIHKDDIVKSDAVPGAKTGSRVRVLGSDKWLVTTEYYDAKGRSIQIIGDNIAGGKDIVTKLYDFKDRNISTYHYHTNPGSTAIPEIRLLEIVNMDHAGRIQNVRLRLNDDPALERVIVANTYYDNGELNNKSLGGLRNVAYDYFLNGSLRSINRSYITDGSTGSFGEELFYDYGFTSSLMTGEIAGIKWRGDGPARAYGYSYDGAGRLLRADFTQNDGGNWLQGNVNFSVSGPATNANQIKYDANGNIEALHQKGLKGAVSDDIDLLQYVYYDNSNRLKRVTDGKNDAASLLGDFKEKTTGQEIDYTFDGNGNLTKDENKNITGITYNEIDMPEHIVIPGKGNIQFKYSADGVKHQKIINDQSSGTPKQVKYDYINGLLYENGILKYISHAEGRIRVIQKPGVPVAYWFDYFIKDHLGDIRVVYTEQSDLTTYMAGMEPSAAAVENSLFSNVDNTRQQKPSGYPNSDSTNKFAARLNAKFPDKRIGPSLVLKVMAGDTVQLKVNAFHKSQAAEKWQSPAGPVVDMLTPLMQTFGGGASAGSSKGTNVDAATPFSQNFADNHYQKLKQKESRSPENPLRPKAYLNYVLFDEQFNMVEENSGVKQVESTPDIVQTLYKDKAKVTRNGYLYVYTSNESQQDVYFDDLIVIMNTGRLLEETHYYPFGLTMEGISSKAATPATYPENKYRFNGKELQNDEFGNGNGLEWYDYGARMFDPQIGRWNAIDGAANKYYNLSPYHFSNNNPVYFKDVDGNSFFPSQWNYPTFDVQGMIGKAAQRSIEYNNWVNNTEEGRAHRIVRHGVNAIMADVWKAIGPYRTSSDRGRNDDGEGMAGMANKLYGQMTNALISVVPVLGSTVRALQAAQHGDKKGAVVNAAFAAMEGLSLVGGLRTVASSGARVSGFSAETGALRTVGARYSGNIAGSKMYIPKTPLAQQKVAGIDIPLPNSDAGSYAHTVLGRKLGSDGIIYRQSATFTGGSWPLANKSIVPWSRVDWSTHGRPLIHPFPHQHIFNFNGKNWVSGNAVPFP